MDQHSTQNQKKYVLKSFSITHLKNIPFKVENRRFQSRTILQNDRRIVQNHTSPIFARKSNAETPNFGEVFGPQIDPRSTKSSFEIVINI